MFSNARELIDGGHTITVTVVGHSMEPFFESYRDEVKLCKCEAVKVDDFVLALTDADRYVAHRVVEVCGDVITMRGDGNVYGVEHARKRDIVGIITHYRKKGQREFRKLYTLKWRLYSRLWPKNPFARRVLLAFHHHVYLRLLWLAAKPEWITLDKNNNKE